MTSPVLTLRSPAKINVFLEVLGRRSDGFHELETVMLRSDLCDVLTFKPADSLLLRLVQHASPAIQSSFPLDDSNLILKAAQALQRYAGITPGARITVRKRIPAEAGLAGGSSNAATTLLALNRLWNLNLPRATLHEIAATLGSDVNFFIAQTRAAVCHGRGELVRPIPVGASMHVVAIRPATGNSTPAVFHQLALPDDPLDAEQICSAIRIGATNRLITACFNRLTCAARHLNTDMVSLMDRTEAVCGRPVFMSGSGSTCFVFARSRREALRLVRLLAPLQPSFVAALRI